MEDNNNYYIGVHYQNSEKPYCFSTSDDDFKMDDMVVVDTPNGTEIAFVCILAKPLSTYAGKLALKPILRKANKSDVNNYNYNAMAAQKAIEITQDGIAKLSLPMNIISGVYNLEGNHITITYTTPEKRVDFRELLKLITPHIEGRVELRQIAPRDKAKMIGGLGLCGMSICCTTFLDAFEGISISRAKNQMLTVNIPKLSGQCGKLKCCLAFEDDTYTIEKKDFPKLGTIVKFDEGEYKVDSFNIISRTVRLANATRDDFKTYPLEDVKAMLDGTYKKKDLVKTENEFSLPDFHIVESHTRDVSYGGMNPDKQDKTHYHDAAKRDNQGNGKWRYQNRNNKGQKNAQKNNTQGNSQNAQGGDRKPRHHYYRPHRRQGNKPENK